MLQPYAPTAWDTTTDFTPTKMNNIEQGIKNASLSDSIAPAEQGDTSTTAYAENEYFMFKGQRVKATSAIEIGDTITIGNNCTREDVQTALDNTNDRIDNFTNIIVSEITYSTADGYEVFDMNDSKILGFMILNSNSQVIDTQVVMTDYFKVVNRVWFDGTGFLCAYADSTHIYLSDITSSVTKFIVFKIL